MIPQSFRFVRHFRIDNLEFDLYVKEDGQYMTECLDTESHERTELLYPDFETLVSVFADELTEEELK